MSLRIHFTVADLCNVRVADGPHPLWELVLGINTLQQRELPPRFWGWRDRVRRSAAAGTADILKAACSVVPAAGNLPDFITPSVDELEAQAHFDAMLELPKPVLQADLARTYRRLDRPPRWAHSLHGRGRPDGVIRVLRQSRSIVLEETVWADVRREVEAARHRYAAQLLTGGIDVLLRSLHSSIRWDWPVLEASYPFEVDLRLEGRGLLIVPSYFSHGHPITLIESGERPTLVCPALPDLGGLSADPRGDDLKSLGTLIGRTRAELLAAVTIAASTSQLAERLHISAAVVSQHTKALREAGLISTTRRGQTVRHTITPLGRAVLLRNS
ncbi:helix-turn-helix domain-containing protein [Kribbella sp. NBC_01505]|uniref:ArsR/SmtB family transcription factor n=1 Tax=Kribbella sp. NBC_01505 TaxID=2903580 RepID=UPI00386F1673